MKKIFIILCALFIFNVPVNAVVEYDEDGNVIEYELDDDTVRITSENPDTPVSSDDSTYYGESDYRDTSAEVISANAEDDNNDHEKYRNIIYIVVGSALVMFFATIGYISTKNEKK